MTIGRGLDPAPPPVPIGSLTSLQPGARARVQGRVTNVAPGRAQVRDVSGAIVVTCGQAPPLGAWVDVTGRWSPTALTAESLEVVGLPARTFPAGDGEWLRVFGDGGRRLRALQVRAEARRALRSWFEEEDFLEVETPSAVRSPGLDLHLDALGATGWGEERWLITSPEYHMKRLLAAGLPRIMQLCRCYRRGEHGAQHEPEFTMLEWYRGFADAEAVMDDTERMVASVARAILGTTLIPARGRVVDVTPPWRRMTVAEAFLERVGVSVEDVLPDEERFFRLLVERVEPDLGYPRPVFLTHWPASMASLARLTPEDPRWADRFEAYVDGVELCNGFGELVDPVEQRSRLERDRVARERQDLPAYPIDERFLAALAEGLPPSGGNALGFDRLVMLLLGANEIGEVIAFPQRWV